MKKLFAILLAMTMVATMGAVTFGATTADAAENGTITITPPSGVDSTATNTYNIYKVFDAAGNGTNISYKLVSGKSTAPAGFTVDSAGNVSYSGTSTDGELTAADISAIAAYVVGDNPVATATSTGTENAVSAALPNGFYYITTTTGSVVTISSTNPNATVEDKNSVPTLTKVITSASSVTDEGKKALAQAGSNVTFTATITVGKGAKGYEFHDTMDDANLSYNGDVAVSGIESNQYTVASTLDTGDTLTISFADGIAENTEITITYTATVVSAALSSSPAVNSATVSYGTDSAYKTAPATTSIYNARYTVKKETSDGGSPAGAGFVIANEAGKYYKLDGNTVSWVDGIGDATENVSDADGTIGAFTGLANGTYTLIENTVPDGYNKATDSTFTVGAGDYSAGNLEQASTVTNQAGSVLPSTGGIGTKLFYLIGGILVLGAAVVLITRKRMGGRA